MDRASYRVFHSLVFVESPGGGIFIRAAPLAAFIPDGDIRLAVAMARGTVEHNGVNLASLAAAVRSWNVALDYRVRNERKERERKHPKRPEKNP